MLTLLLTNGSALGAALLGAVAAGLGERTSRLLLGTLAGNLIIIHSTMLVTGLAGHLTGAGVLTLLAAALVLAVWVARCKGSDVPPSTPEPLLTTPALFPLVAALASGVVWAWPHLFTATRLWIFDDYTYHMVYPTLWLREHALRAPTPAQSFTAQAWYPLSADLVASWFMLPFPGSRADALAWVSLTGVLYGALVASATVELLARLGCRPGAWALPVILFTTSSRIGVMASSFSDADLAQAATLFAALVFAVPRGEVETRRDAIVDGWYAALLSGLAIGMKVSAAVPALVILLMILLRIGVRTTALAFGVSWAATGGYWYARNVLSTGNPLYPAAFLGWPGATFPETTLREYSRQYGLGRALHDALVVYLNWPVLHATLAVAGLVGLASWWLVRRGAATRAQVFFAAGALGVAGAVCLLLPATPFSAGNAMTFRAGLVHWDSMRYVAVLPMIGWAALGFLVDAGLSAGFWRSLIAAGITVAALRALVTGLLHWWMAVAAVALVATLLAPIAPRSSAGRPRTARGRALGLGGAALVVAPIVVAHHGEKAAATAAAIHAEPLFGRAAAVLDDQPAGTRIAFLGDQWIYPAFGARHHLHPVRLDGDGRLATAPIGAAMDPGTLTVDPATFRSNLARSDVTIVVIVHLIHPGRSAEWPAQHAALEGRDDARLLYREAMVGVWKLESAPTPPRPAAPPGS